MRNSGKPSGIDVRKKKEMENEWKSLEESNEVNSGDRIGQLNALRFEMRPANKNLPRERSDGISENEMPGTGKFRKQKLTTNTATPRGKLELWILKIMGVWREYLFRGYRAAGP